jgi:hypothetical protein
MNAFLSVSHLPPTPFPRRNVWRRSNLLCRVKTYMVYFSGRVRLPFGVFVILIPLMHFLYGHSKVALLNIVSYWSSYYVGPISRDLGNMFIMRIRNFQSKKFHMVNSLSERHSDVILKSTSMLESERLNVICGCMEHWSL